jgi:hypothetical protein
MSQLKFLEEIRPISQISLNVHLFYLVQDHIAIKELLIFRTRLGPGITIEDDKRYKQDHVRDYDSQNQTNKQFKVSYIFHGIPGMRDGETTRKAQ